MELTELRGRPLLANRPDSRLYVEPSTVLDRLTRSVANGLNAIVYGPRGSGKTSLLYQLLLRLSDSDAGAGARPIVVDASSVEDGLELALRLRSELIGRPSALQEVGTQLGFMTAQLASAPPGTRSSYLLELVREWSKAPPSAVLVDASGSSEAVYALFGRLRDELWQLPHRWVVAIDEDDVPDVLRPPADAFFDIRIQLPRLTPEEIAELLERRGAPLTARDLRRIAVTSDGNPRRALDTARAAVIEDRHVTDILAEQFRRQEAAAQLGRPESMMMAELEGLGSASASDEELLQRLGWTRERAGQVLRNLERHGLVRANDQPGARGRPRKIYTPAT